MTFERSRYRGAAEHCTRQRSNPRQGERATNPDQQRKQDFGPHRPIGPNQKRPLQYLLEQLSGSLRRARRARPGWLANR